MKNQLLLLAIVGTVIFLVAGWFFSPDALTTNVTAEEPNYFEAGQTIVIPTGDAAVPELRLQVIKSKGLTTVVMDGDGDVWTCLGEISERNCEPSGLQCGPVAKMAGWLNSELSLANCHDQASPQPKPADYPVVPTCVDGQRLWVDLRGGRITGYHCA